MIKLTQNIIKGYCKSFWSIESLCRNNGLVIKSQAEILDSYGDIIKQYYCENSRNKKIVLEYDKMNKMLKYQDKNMKITLFLSKEMSQGYIKILGYNVMWETDTW